MTIDLDALRSDCRDVDELLLEGHTNRIPRGLPIGVVRRCIDEIAALRQRCADLEMMLDNVHSLRKAEHPELYQTWKIAPMDGK